MRTKIGLKAIAAMPPNSIIWDTEVRGFNARRQFSEPDCSEPSSLMRSKRSCALRIQCKASISQLMGNVIDDSMAQNTCSWALLLTAAQSQTYSCY
jgi:hypothetical protein